MAQATPTRTIVYTYFIHDKAPDGTTVKREVSFEEARQTFIADLLNNTYAINKLAAACAEELHKSDNAGQPTTQEVTPCQ